MKLDGVMLIRVQNWLTVQTAHIAIPQVAAMVPTLTGDGQ
jgi:hypothetical protein